MKIVIEIRWGRVEAIYADGEITDAVTVDFDTDGAAPEDTALFPVGDGESEPAYWRLPEVNKPEDCPYWEILQGDEFK